MAGMVGAEARVLDRAASRRGRRPTTARTAAGVSCRLHDLRHTCSTRLLERGVPLAVVASLMGWSAATTTRMAKRYSHFGQSTHRQAMDTLDTRPPMPSEPRPDAPRDVH